MDTYQLLIDIWAGQNQPLQPDILAAGGVVGIISRINGIAGGLHLDEKFADHWDQSAGFIRPIYYVYNPWNTGKENFAWLKKYAPSDCVAVMPDIEVIKTGYSKDTYAQEVDWFVQSCLNTWRTFVYTGGWFLPNLSRWPKVDYCWARYYGGFYLGKGVTKITDWNEINHIAQSLPWMPDLPTMRCPGTVRLLQASGDTFKLPGYGGGTIDIILWPGDRASLESWIGMPFTYQHTSTDHERLNYLWDWAVTQGMNPRMPHYGDEPGSATLPTGSPFISERAGMN